MLDLVTTDNLHLGCHARNKAEVMEMIGRLFKDKGYVNQDCIASLNEREKQISTFLGNGIVLPHLPKSAQNMIVKPGVEIFQFPDGIIWDRTNVMFIAIGVVAKNQEHIGVLKDVGLIFSNEIIANALSLISNKEDFLRILNRP